MAESGLPNEINIAAGLKEGSYWHMLAHKYVNGTPEHSTIKAIYNVWRSKFFVKLVTERLQLKVKYSLHR